MTFADLPEPFLTALGTEIRSKRAVAGEEVVHLVGALPDVTALLAGRTTTDVTTADGTPAPSLSPWL